MRNAITWSPPGWSPLPFRLRADQIRHVLDSSWVSDGSNARRANVSPEFGTRERSIQHHPQMARAALPVCGCSGEAIIAPIVGHILRGGHDIAAFGDMDGRAAVAEATATGSGADEDKTKRSGNRGYSGSRGHGEGTESGPSVEHLVIVY